MGEPSYTGLTWDHPRGFRALQAAASLAAPDHGLQIEWAIQPLEGFESEPIAELCARYDLVVLDHPHLGDAIEAGCLVSIESILGGALVSELEQASIGQSLASYQWDGQTWALPLDAASQVIAFRPDRLAFAPQTWAAILELPQELGIALSLAGPHCLLTLFSILTALGHPPGSNGSDTLVDEQAGLSALDLLRILYARRVERLDGLNPIGILNAMSRSDDVSLCPLVFGYVNYARPTEGLHALAFADAPRIAVNGRRGSILGGTGIGVTQRCQVTPQLVTHLQWLLSEAGQRIFIPSHDGQPSRRSAWYDPEVNKQWGDFYRATAATLEQAHVRPRIAAYVPWQNEASARLREVLAADNGDHAIIAWINESYSQLAKGGRP
jgi:multiple sugar transport system substrate-binding protein